MWGLVWARAAELSGSAKGLARVPGRMAQGLKLCHPVAHSWTGLGQGCGCTGVVIVSGTNRE